MATCGATRCDLRSIRLVFGILATVKCGVNASINVIIDPTQISTAPKSTSLPSMTRVESTTFLLIHVHAD
jgi:hypothetical protein